MYTVKPLNPSTVSASKFIDDDLVRRMKMTGNCFITDVFLLDRLSKMDFPIKNRKLATIRLLEFLAFLDIEILMNDGDTLLEIPFVKFEKYFARNHVNQYKQILQKLNIITVVPYPDGSFYRFKKSNLDTQPGKCMQFRVHNGYLQPKHIGLVIFKPGRKPKSTPSVVNYTSGLDEKYISTIVALKIDVEAAIQAEFEFYRVSHQNIFRFKARVSIVLRTERDRSISKGDKSNRIYHSFTNVSRVSRQFFNIQFNNVDVKNCQPLLLVSYLSANQLPFDVNYKEDCELSLFYNRFVGINGLEKDAAKVKLYKSTFFGFDKRSRFNKKFKELYPTTWQSLADLKLKGVSLAAELQNLESSLFNYIVPVLSEYYFTLFDAVYFTNIDDTYAIVKEIESFFEELGTNVMVRLNDEEVQDLQ